MSAGPGSIALSCDQPQAFEREAKQLGRAADEARELREEARAKQQELIKAQAEADQVRPRAH